MREGLNRNSSEASEAMNSMVQNRAAQNRIKTLLFLHRQLSSRRFTIGYE